ncbi:helix-turn-helix domain-containing protein [Nocardiopsis sp. RSe5-2]|uniref:Helix-turn-helix domain-containing protein n=1 Tax=Nocardiopsis endophytica TaxID=3018445 RepID=A0ABT4U6G8_9ACTN|nr:helix-turn-helix domain-containing protein [Nocardiopsis endophytica]MDA2812538.1 helix-turn-helix domain-containing protein [Nocardiopsis endophytica]
MDVLLDSLRKNRPREIRIFHPASAGAATLLSAVTRRALSSGSQVRMVVERRSGAEPGLPRAFRTQCRAGARIRTADSVPHCLVLLDRTMAVLASQGAGEPQWATLVRERTMLSGLSTLFDLVWASATPADEVPEAPGPEPEALSNAMTRQLILLLSEGLNDEDAARELGTSLRTVRRHVAEIKEMVNAKNRFQTAVRLTKRGLL